MKFLVNLLTLVLAIGGVLVLASAPWMAWLAAAVLVAAWMWLTRAGRQARAVTGIGLRALPSRLGASLVVVVGIAGVVAVLVSLLAMAEGYRHTLDSTGSADTAIVLRGGSAAEVNSVLDHDTLVVVADAPGVARSDDGKPIASGELVVAANLPRRQSNDPEELGSVQFRGVDAQAWALRPDTHIVAGRVFKPGLRELVVGRGAQRQFAGLELGHQLRLGTQLWTVVGVFQTAGALESEIWADTADVASAYRRGSGLSSVYVRLVSPGAYPAFKAALAADPRLKVDVSPTLEYYGKQSETITKVIRVIGIVVGTIMAIGAVFGALNTMFAAIAARAR
jgi:putative ABC transport system permease protein